MEESDENTLGKLIDSTLARIRGKIATVLLTVDDALWFKDFNAAAAMRLLSNAKHRVYAVHAKLCPRVEYAHPNNKFMRVPPFQSPCHTNEDSATEFLIFERERGEYDWNYPWELSASLYRLESVEEVLKGIRSEFGFDAADHPNHLEGYGVRLLKQQKLTTANASPYCACPSDPVVAVVTINRVQSLFENPIYAQSDGSEISVEELDQVLRYGLLQSGLVDSDEAQADLVKAAAFLSEKLDMPCSWWKTYLEAAEPFRLCSWTSNFDLTRQWPPNLLHRVATMYAGTYLDSVHVPLPSSVMKPSLCDPMVSWLMPVKDTPSQWLDLALDSIQQQEGIDGSWELIVVDDGSSQIETKQTLAAWAQKPHIQAQSARGHG
eukprot:Skav229909  [mRNA]  locus=scaffold2151:514090:515223:- [translate_table: standard]